MTTNPFSTRFVRPGAISYSFPAGETADGLVRRLAARQWKGQIVGPHGSGKSTLLHTLRPAIEQSGRRVRWFEMSFGQRQFPFPQGSQALAEGDLVIIDGYEQLSWTSRSHVNWKCHRQGCGLLVTSHEGQAFFELWRTDVQEPTALEVVATLIDGWPWRPADEDVLSRLRQHGGNLRETLFDLYDLYESSGAESSSVSTS